MSARGFSDLSPPEAQHAMLELPTNRVEYVGVLQDMGDYPARSPIGQRVPTPAEVAALQDAGGAWRGVVLLDDDRALRASAWLFESVFVLDPFYDSGALLYAAWHDPYIKDEHSRRLAEQAGLLVRLAPLLNSGTALLAPEHLPGSWNPRPGWPRPRPNADPKQLAAWAMRTGLVLLYWADRLNAVVAASRADVLAALDVILGGPSASSGVELPTWPTLDDTVAFRADHVEEVCEMWHAAQRASRRRGRGCLDDIAYAIKPLTEDVRVSHWRLALGEPSVPDPGMLIRRVLNGQDPERLPALPRKRLRRRPLCVLST